MVKSINRFRQGVIFLGLTFLPLFYIPGYVIPFEIPKVMFIYIWGCLIAILTLVDMIAGGEIKTVGKTNILALLWAGSMLLASWWGADPAKSWWGNYYRWDGLMTLLFLLTIYMVLNLSDRKKWFEPALRGIALGSVLSAIWAVGQLITKRGAGFDGYGAGFGQPVFLAGYLLVTTPIVWYKLREKMIGIPAMIVICLALWATKSLAVLICMPVVILGILIINNKISRKLAIACLFIFFIAALGIYTIEIKQRSEAGGLVYEGRGRIFTKAYLAFRERPFWGYGVANFDKAFDKVVWPQRFGNDVYIDKAHSSLVEVAVGGGVVGLVTYLLLLGQIFFSLRKRRDVLGKYLFLTLIVYLIHSQTNIISVNEELVFWLVAAGASIG